MSNCDNKVNILDKWSPSANLSRNSQCEGCLKFNVDVLNKPLNTDEFVTVSTTIFNTDEPLLMPKSFDGTSIFNGNGTGYICRSKLIKNNTLYVYLGNNNGLIFKKELKINYSQCEYNIKINNT
jgi:hypothetical protein